MKTEIRQWREGRDSTEPQGTDPSSLVCEYKQDILFCYLGLLCFPSNSMERIPVTRMFLHHEDQELSTLGSNTICTLLLRARYSPEMARPRAEHVQRLRPRSDWAPDCKGRSQLGSGSSCLTGGQCLLWPFQTVMPRVCEQRKMSGFHATAFKELFYTAVATLSLSLHSKVLREIFCNSFFTFKIKFI